MINSETIALAEVFEVLSYMNKSTVMNIPVQILQYIKNNRDREYISKIDKNDIFNKDNISVEAQTILAWLDMEYLASKENKKIKLKIYEENEKKYQASLEEKYDKFDIFKTKNIDKIKEKDLQIIEYKEKIITKFVKFIKKLLKI